MLIAFPPVPQAGWWWQVGRLELPGIRPLQLRGSESSFLEQLERVVMKSVISASAPNKNTTNFCEWLKPRGYLQVIHLQWQEANPQAAAATLVRNCLEERADPELHPSFAATENIKTRMRQSQKQNKVAQSRETESPLRKFMWNVSKSFLRLDATIIKYCTLGSTK